MEIRPIRTEADYEAAMRRIETLWGSDRGTPQGDELDVLATLVEAYERAHYPIDLPDPIEAIKFRLEQEGKDYRAGVDRRDRPKNQGLRSHAWGASLVPQHDSRAAQQTGNSCRGSDSVR